MKLDIPTLGGILVVLFVLACNLARKEEPKRPALPVITGTPYGGKVRAEDRSVWPKKRRRRR